MTFFESSLTAEQWFAQMEEAKQRGVIYHFTNEDRLYSILSANALKSQGDVTYNGIEYPQISLTRDFALKNVIGDGSLWGPCRISLDGDRLSNRYKIVPYDDLEFDKKLRRGEREEAVLAKEVTPLYPYILQIDILVNARTAPLKTVIQDMGKFEQEGFSVSKYGNIVVQRVNKFLPYKYQKVV